MIINEKGLLKAMKEAYKGGGYTVAAMQEYETVAEKLVIHTGYFLVSVERKHCPNAILGMIVQHSGLLPRVGEAYRISKGITQTVVFGTVESLVEDCRIMREADMGWLLQTKLTMNGWEVWQEVTSLRILLLDPALSGIVKHNEDGGYAAENTAYFSGDVSEAYIMRRRPEDAAEECAVAHLAAMQWVGK